MAYGELKVDSITFTNGGTDTTVLVSGLVQNPTFSGDITVTGTISGDVVKGGTLVSGVTVSGTAGEFGTVTGNTAGFTTVTGTTVTGTTGQFTSITGGTAGFTTVTGTTVTGNSGNFTTLTTTTANVTTGVFASGTAAAPSVSVGTTDNGIYSPGTDQVALSTNGTGRLFVDANGNVGVGTSSPLATLHVRGSSAPRIENTGTESLLRFQNSSAENVYFGSNASNAVIYTQSTERLRITSDGKVGIGTSSPAERLDIAGQGNSYLRWEQDGSTGSYGTSGGVLRIGPYNAATDRELALFTDNSNKSWITTGSVQTLVLGTNKTARITIHASLNRVGIGTTSPASTLDVNGDLTITDKIIHSSDTNTAIRFPANDTVSIETAGTEQLRITSDRYVRLASGSGGIQFNGDTAAANALDDYEEGTWTPQFSFATPGDLSVSYTSQTGNYRIVGKLCIATFILEFTPTYTTSSGTARVSGLPLINGTYLAVPASVNRFSGFAVVDGFDNLWLRKNTNQAYVEVYQYGRSGSTTVSPTEATSGSAKILNGTIIFNLT